MAVNCSPFGPKPAFFLADGTPAVGYQLFMYVGGSTSTKQNTYTDYTGGVANTNPIVMNSLGEPATQIWFIAGQTYKAVLAPATDTDPPTSPIWTIDGLVGINDTSVSIDQWVAGPAPTYIGATSFSLVGDQTQTFQVGRRVKTTNSGGTVYGTITVSAYTTLTTVTVVNDSGALDSGLSAVSYGLLSPTNPSTPLLGDAYPIVSGSIDPTKKLRFEVDGLTTATTRVITMSDENFTTPTTGTIASTFTFDGSGGTSGSITMAYQKNGKFVTLYVPVVTATTGTASVKLAANTALPAAIRPSANTQVSVSIQSENNGIVSTGGPGQIVVSTGGIISIYRDAVQTAFTNSTTCGMGGDTTFTYFIG